MDEVRQLSTTDVEMRYLKEEIRDLTKNVVILMAKQDERFEALSTIYVRKDILEVTFRPINELLAEMRTEQKSISVHIPMLQDMKKERESLKNIVINYVTKGLFYTAATIFALYAVLKK